MSRRDVFFMPYFALASLLMFACPPARALTNGVALTPPMGFNSFYNYSTGVSEAVIKSIADQMATNGMLAAGYQYINVDDGWATSRDTNGVIVADTNKFPDGMKALADYVHAKGFKFGIYTTASSNTCAQYVGSANHLVQDVNTFASWGVDYVKYEGCNVSLYEIEPRQQIYFARMQQALAQCGRPMVFSCSVGTFENWMPQYINVFRGSGDDNETWANVLAHIDYVAQTPSFAGPGQWNDPDVMEIGSGYFTDLESTSIMTMWSILAAPLLDLSSGSTHTNILCNAEAIAVDQDAAGLQGVCVNSNGDYQVWRKWLGSSNSTTLAVALFNRGTNTGNITANWSDLGLPPGVAAVRDLWAHAYAGNFTNSYTASIPGHGVQMLKLSYGVLVPPPLAGTDYLSGLSWLSDITNQITLLGNVPIELNQSAAQTTITINGVQYTNGLGMLAYTKVSYLLGGAASRFQATVGLDPVSQLSSTITFRVYADGTKIYDSGSMAYSSPAQSIDVDVTGRNILSLEVSTSGTTGNADWANARIIVPPAPQFSTFAASGGNLSLSGVRGVPGTVYYLLSTTNPILPMAQWTRIATNYFDMGGNFNLIAPYSPQTPAAYFTIETQ